MKRNSVTIELPEYPDGIQQGRSVVLTVKAAELLLRSLTGVLEKLDVAVLKSANPLGTPYCQDGEPGAVDSLSLEGSGGNHLCRCGRYGSQ